VQEDSQVNSVFLCFLDLWASLKAALKMLAKLTTDEENGAPSLAWGFNVSTAEEFLVFLAPQELSQVWFFLKIFEITLMSSSDSTA
jgi:hypothetical protein